MKTITIEELNAAVFPWEIFPLRAIRKRNTKGMLTAMASNKDPEEYTVKIMTYVPIIRDKNVYLIPLMQEINSDKSMAHAESACNEIVIDQAEKIQQHYIVDPKLIIPDGAAPVYMVIY